MSVSPQGYNLGGEPYNENPFWGEGEDADVNRIFATAEITGGTGTPSVQTSKTVVGHDITFGFSFNNLKGADGTNGRDGTNGTNGTDGVSPTITVTDITGGHRVDITDITGTHSFNVMNGTNGRDGTNGTDGRDGTDGVSPSVSVSDITGGHRITVTDATGSETFDVMNGTNGRDGRDGTNGTNGQDGVSPTIDVVTITGGHRVDITDAQGTESFNVMNGTDGRDGTNGTNGQDGVTPDISMSATADATASASPTVTVTKSGTAANPAFALAFSGLKGAPGQDAEWPAGGSAGDILTKTASGVAWETPSGGGYTPKVYTYNDTITINNYVAALQSNTSSWAMQCDDVYCNSNFVNGNESLTAAQIFDLYKAGKGYLILRGYSRSTGSHPATYDYNLPCSMYYDGSYHASGCARYVPTDSQSTKQLFFIRTAE